MISVKKFLSDANLETALLILLALLALSRWQGRVDQMLGFILAVVSLVLWIKPGAAPKIYSKIKHPGYVLPLVAALGFAIATHLFLFYLAFSVLAMLQYLRFKRERRF